MPPATTSPSSPSKFATNVWNSPDPMPSYVTPGVYFESADQASPRISAIRTDITAFLGVAQKGPLNQPLAVNTWEQFYSAFGDFLPNAYLAYSAKAFFENG